MNLQVDVERVVLAHKTVRAELLAERHPGGHWVGHLASSPLATATAISALVAAHTRDSDDALRQSSSGDGQVLEHLVQSDLSELLVESLHWLARHQNPDGGWGDCDIARSNVAATMLVQAAFRLTGVPAKYADLIARADQFVAAQGGIAGLRRQYDKDKTLIAPILANCALAGMVPWRQVPTLPFELACVPKRWQHHFQVPVARHAMAALIAVGRAKFQHDPPRNPIMRLVRRSVRVKSLAILERLQSADDSFLSSTPLTAFVVMSLADIGLQEHPIVQRGVEFLLSSVRGDSSWPIKTNLATSNTTLALNSLAPDRLIGARVPVPLEAQHGRRHPGTSRNDTANSGDTLSYDLATTEASQSQLHASDDQGADKEPPFSQPCLDWLLQCQRTKPNPLTNVPAGGWGWSDVPGALPNANDTSGALVALAHWRRRDEPSQREPIERAARLGIGWLLDLQNEDGGWPTLYRDSGPLQFDESGTDVTALALRALGAWLREWLLQRPNATPQRNVDLVEQIAPAIEHGWRYLETQQRADGDFIPLWFGNEHQPEEHNPVYGTAEVLVTCDELERLDTEMARRAARWLLSAQHSGGGWGPPRAPLDYSGAEKDGFRAWRANESMATFCSVEETALAVTALLPLTDISPAFSRAVSSGLTWLAGAVEQDAHRRPAVIGFSLSKMWYHERLYPLVFAAGALAQAVRRLAPKRHAITPVGSP